MKTKIKENDFKKVFEVLKEWGGIWYNYSTLEDETGIPVKSLKNIMRVLLYVQIVRYGCLYDDDRGRIMGMGYSIEDQFADIEFNNELGALLFDQLLKMESLK